MLRTLSLCLVCISCQKSAPSAPLVPAPVSSTETPSAVLPTAPVPDVPMVVPTVVGTGKALDALRTQTSTPAGRERLDRWRDADIVIDAMVKTVTDSGCLESFPPQCSVMLEVTHAVIVKGHGFDATKQTLGLSTGDGTKPKPSVGDHVILSVDHTVGTIAPVEQQFTVTHFEVASQAALALLRQYEATRVQGIELRVTQVPPTVPKEYVNPYGDGEFLLTLRNLGTTPAHVPGLVKSPAGTIDWEGSLRIYEDRHWMKFPGHTAALPGATEVELAAGETIEMKVNTLKLPITGMIGGGRLYFKFAFMDESLTSFFYYSSQYHDPMRTSVLAGGSASGAPGANRPDASTTD